MAYLTLRNKTRPSHTEKEALSEGLSLAHRARALTLDRPSVPPRPWTVSTLWKPTGADLPLTRTAGALNLQGLWSLAQK